jgi:putative Mn2+ efflux pump MntP
MLILAVGLSMDAFAVSICKGLSLGKVSGRHMILAGAWFGGFQALMPLLGWLLGSSFAHLIAAYDHWVVFILLVLIGGNMIREALGEEARVNAGMTVLQMLPLAIATSIDALAAGVTLPFLEVNIFSAIAVIGCVTFAFSAAGIRIGSLFGTRWRRPAEIVGGVILICIGCQTLLEHLGILG